MISAVSDELIAMKKYVAGEHSFSGYVNLTVSLAMESEMAGLKGPQWDPTTFRKKVHSQHHLHLH